MKIAIFGGSFDPVHLGHMNLCVQIQESQSLDKVLFCPTYVSPFKLKNKPIASPKDRIAMLKLSLEGLAFADILDYEIQDSGPSYTINTLKKVQQTYPNDTLYFIAGEDVISHFSFWKEPETILKIAKPLIGSRELKKENLSLLDHRFRDDFKQNYYQIHNFDISSSYVRERLFQDKYCGHLVPLKVLDYISKHKLYSNTLKNQSCT